MKTMKQFRETVGALLDWGRTELSFLDSREAEWSTLRLLEGVTGRQVPDLRMGREKPVEEREAEIFRLGIERRRSGEPVAYILGTCGFWNQVLEVGPGCLIPRPETELLVAKALEVAPQEKPWTFLDLGCGSGAVGIALLAERERASGTFSDVSQEALELARKNLEKTGFAHRAETVCGDLFENMEGQRWDMILSNPPYLSRDDMNRLQPELRHEPSLALFGGEDGTDFYRRILDGASRHLTKDGMLLMELGIHQAARVQPWAEKRFKQVDLYPDYSGIERVLMARGF